MLILLNKAEKSLSNAVNAVKNVKKEETPFTEELLKAYAEVGEANVLLVEANVLLVEAEAYAVEKIYNANQQFVLSVIETICFIYYFYKENFLPIPEQTEPIDGSGMNALEPPVLSSYQIKIIKNKT